MKHEKQDIIRISSVKQMHSYIALSCPLNPLITIIDHAQTQKNNPSNHQKLVLDFYNISIKRSFKGTLKYGKNHYDYDDGIMSFMAPNQIISIDSKMYPLVKTVIY